MDYSKKYENFLKPEDCYELLLKIQKDLSKISRNKNMKEFEYTFLFNE